MSRLWLVPLLAGLVAAWPAVAEPIVDSGQGPFQGQYTVDPILYYQVAYREKGTTDCYHPPDTCNLEGPGEDAGWVKVQIVGEGGVHFFLDDARDPIRHKQLLSATCSSPGGYRECHYRLSPRVSSPSFFLQVTNTWGEAGTVIHLKLERGSYWQIAGQDVLV